MEEYDIGRAWSPPVPAPALQGPDRLRLVTYKLAEVGGRALAASMLAAELAVTSLHGVGVLRPSGPPQVVITDGTGGNAHNDSASRNITVFDF